VWKYNKPTELRVYQSNFLLQRDACVQQNESGKGITDANGGNTEKYAP
jgi:hypothetical protein